MKRTKQYFLTGLIAITPMALTGWILWRFYRFVDNLLRPLLEQGPFLRDQVPDVLVTLMGLLIFFGLILAAGLFTRNLLGTAFFSLVEKLFTRIPVVKGIFSATKQISEVLLKDTGRAFKKVVVFSYPRPGVYAVGFVTYEDPDRNLLNIFLPTTPNPTSGFLLFVPREQARVLPMSVEEGVKLIISGGAVVTVGVNRCLDLSIAELAALEDGNRGGGGPDE